MHSVTLAAPDDFDGWRDAARALVLGGVAPDDVAWRVAGEGAGLFEGDAPPPASVAPGFAVPRAFLEVARRVVCHRDPERFALLYRALVALRVRPRLIEDIADPLVRRLELLDKGVRRDVHKMRAFVRFRSVEEPEGERFVAWFEPEHHIVRLNSGFFVRRFAAMRWSILTPELCVHWDGSALLESPGATRDAAVAGDPVEALWRDYYASIFNPARLKVDAMVREMPRKYWKNLPEAADIPGLIAGAGARTQAMIAAAEGETPAPGADLAQVRAAAAVCTRCPLYAPATQTVFGEGPATATLMLVGEQPGDQEDLAGRPFVGPAGQVLDRALAAAGVVRERTYVTNAVKHFKFEPRGKRRIHSKPDTGEIEACRWWLEEELRLVAPRVVVALGATAARALTGRTVTIGRERGRPQPLAGGAELRITVHPSYLLRIEDGAAADAEFERFVADLAAARAALGEG